MSETSDEVRITRLETRVGELDKSQAILSAIFERSLASQEKSSVAIDNFSNTLTEFRFVMVDIQGKLTSYNTDLNELKRDFKNLREEVEKKLQNDNKEITQKIIKVEQKLQDLEDKGKIDWISEVKSVLVKVLFGGGIIAILIIVIDWLSSIINK